MLLCNFICSYSMKQKCLYDVVQLRPNDSILLHDLPQDILGYLIQYVGKGDIKSIITTLNTFKCVCKKLERALCPLDKLKDILNISQKKLDSSLLRFTRLNEKNNFAFLVSLLAMGASPKYRNVSHGRTCLHHAVNKELVELFIKYGADINQTDYENKTLLHRAVCLDKTEVIEVLLAHKAQINVKDIYGDTPINIVLKYGKLETLRILMRHGVDVGIPYKVWSQFMTIVEWAEMQGYLASFDDIPSAPWYQDRVARESCVIL